MTGAPRLRGSPQSLAHERGATDAREREHRAVVPGDDGGGRRDEGSPAGRGAGGHGRPVERDVPALIQQDAVADGSQRRVGIGEAQHAVVGERDQLRGEQDRELETQSADVAEEHEGAVGPVGGDRLAAEALAQLRQPARVLVLLEHEQLDRPLIVGVAGRGGQALQPRAVTGLAELEARERAGNRSTAGPLGERCV